MANFCTNCGTRLGKDDNFCTNCGTRIDKTDMGRNNSSSKSMFDSIEKRKARIEEQEMGSKKIEIEKTYKGYCNFSCIHHREQYINADGGDVGFDFTGEEIIDYYCALGYDVAQGSFCKDYEG